MRRYLYADERGSIVALTDANGTALAINSYDEYGIPAAGNAGRFQYTGQARIPELGMYHYKARIYSPTLGRFLQTDPIGYEDQFNLYAYVGNDPVNGADPTGMIWDGILKGRDHGPCGGFDLDCVKTINLHDITNLESKDSSDRGIGDNSGPPLDEGDVSKSVLKWLGRAAGRLGGVAVSLLWSEPAGEGSDQPGDGYTDPARQRMQDRGISEARVNEARQNGVRTLQENGNYRYDIAPAISTSGRGLTVVVNYERGPRIITVIDRGSKFAPK